MGLRLTLSREVWAGMGERGRAEFLAREAARAGGSGKVMLEREGFFVWLWRMLRS